MWRPMELIADIARVLSGVAIVTQNKLHKRHYLLS